MRKIAPLPNLVTLGNLVCGFTAVAALVHPDKPFGIFKDGIVAGAWLVMLGMAFDMLDGKLARLTSVTSNFGGQLDSLSDCVTFGVAPGMIIITASAIQWELAWLLATLYVICAALRLARFNVEHSSRSSNEEYFKGLPSPAAAGLVASVLLFDRHAMIIFDKHTVIGPLHTEFTLPLVGLAAGLLMVSRVRYPHLMSWIFRGKRQFTDLVRLVFVCAFIALDLFALKVHFAFMVLFSAYAVSGMVQTAKILVLAGIRRHRTPPEEIRSRESL